MSRDSIILNLHFTSIGTTTGVGTIAGLGMDVGSSKTHALIVDETGLLSVRQMLALVEVGQRQGCRIILCGDARQHSIFGHDGEALPLQIGVKPLPPAAPAHIATRFR